jgi:hypothetical protein
VTTGHGGFTTPGLFTEWRQSLSRYHIDRMSAALRGALVT